MNLLSASEILPVFTPEYCPASFLREKSLWNHFCHCSDARCYGDLSCSNRYEEDADDLDTKKDNVESNKVEESYDEVLTREILQTLTNMIMLKCIKQGTEIRAWGPKVNREACPWPSTLKMSILKSLKNYIFKEKKNK